MPTLGKPEVFLQAGEDLFDADGKLGLATRPLLQDWMERYIDWVTRQGGCPNWRAQSPALSQGS